MIMAPKPRFADGEKVLCFHGPLLYEAKCMKCQIKEKNVKYFIHYSGWNKNWDEWVPESRVLKYNDANMQKQKELEAAHGKVKKSKAGKSGSKKEPSDRESTALPPQEKTQKQKNKEAAATAASTSTESQAEIQRKKRTRAEQNVETEEEYTQKLEIRVKIPDELKHRLVDDWDLVTRQKKLVQLPARVPVETIISDYIKQRVSVKGMTPNKETAIVETTNGIREYFNVMLGKQLLYKFERPQHAELLSENPDMTPSQIYGAIHLLRLFTKIGGALAYTQLDEDTVSLITSNLYDFQKYMAKSAGSLFSSNDYIPATPEYLKKVG
ncbi:Mortality factor 4-like protein 1 [Araneus ventricosus]|uniref:Mortality factor 4-like protein 1 n=1 Tax=Araneus ventricosus TaxID=182803 RepID=A0A4Y2MG26_ARAVE|nr:Mortality factor 4-like protein 1 [Araneus ventricosus]